MQHRTTIVYMKGEGSASSHDFVEAKVTRNEILDDISNVERKQWITEGTIRVRESLSYPTAEDLETRVLSNELFRCVIHTWDEDEDYLLWHLHDDTMKEKEYRGNTARRELGWKCIQEGFTDFKHHLVAIDFLKGRIIELYRDKNCDIKPGFGRSMMDIDNCILYSNWTAEHDKHILHSYKQLLQSSKEAKAKEFLNGEDWQQIQLQFQINFYCCPTQTQIQNRLRYLLNNMNH
ncbi:hypothetical protein MA16_Dca021797 [Dendrobium catenatum]|uniref:Uncharacterized protein n=1 Tax=Dendrobium catenatum TaxID=906689 RepID=A0A2I0WXW6_9ASPA|nr:hypothetical protein MA16_Dca021797 [Dendrobium catenatum]